MGAEGWSAIAEANGIFGYVAWDPKAFRQVYR
jgi:recombination DNA repair RAD52 pathway protein